MILKKLKLLVLLSISAILVDESIATCKDTIPGLNKMVKGVDITTLDLVPLEGIKPNGFKFPVLNMTCFENSMWTSPSNRISYQRPDQMWSITTIPGGYSEADVTVLRTSSDVRKKMSAGIEIGAGYWGFAFSASKSFSKMQNAITKFSKQIEDVSSFESATGIDWKPSWAPNLIDKFAQQYIDNHLTGSYEDNSNAYDNFVKTFGTHYFTRAVFGGMIRSYMETSNDYSETGAERKKEAHQSFKALISGFYALSGKDSEGESENTVSSKFKAATTTINKYYGGSANLLQQGGITKWQPSVDADPWLFSGNLAPIFDLVKDEIKKKNLKIAVDQYVQRAYLKELLQLIIQRKIKNPDAILDDLYKRINKQLNSKTLDLQEATSLNEAVEYHMTVPDWFTKHTQLCLQYHVKESGLSKCNDKQDTLPQTICAFPNSNTAYYLDKPLPWSSGCVMKWSIASMSSPSWFLKTKICVKWESDGKYSKCNEAGRGEVCASVNEMTSQYVDNTQFKDDACRMSWRIQLGDNPPLWLKGTQLCFQWYSDKPAEARQCGTGAKSRKLCAHVGSWTEWYKDHTQANFKSGCKLSWGWDII